MTARRKGLMQLALSTGLLLALFLVVDMREIGNHLSQLDPRWALAAVAALILQIALLAWRWRFTALRLGMWMSCRHALREYYFGVFLNQLLPGGILGDVSRAWRHARLTTRTRTAVHAVVLERVIVQATMVGIALASLTAIPALRPAMQTYWLWAAIAVVTVVLAAWVLRALLPAIRTAITGFRDDALRAYLPTPVLLVQLFTAILVTVANLAAYAATARALGVDIPIGTLLPLIAPVLLVMMLPISVAGWGVREGAAALLWTATGLDVAQGVAVAVAFGLLFLVAALPGAFGLAGAREAETGPERGQGQNSRSNSTSSPSEN
ncbi:lysylphosphatidylglycerol synthase transmembrane domain-containing protein [Thioalkalivibrio sp.]|uniref:lysylphosphatidylglycerol synthase transmembrane domain-containing protein n=1 Tax=Thioalkalivibrio sp. TaxID=2093813 RepID=UPI003564EFF5